MFLTIHENFSSFSCFQQIVIDTLTEKKRKQKGTDMYWIGIFARHCGKYLHPVYDETTHDELMYGPLRACKWLTVT